MITEPKGIYRASSATAALARFAEAHTVLQAQGATLVPITLATIDSAPDFLYEFRSVLKGYLARQQARAPIRTLDELIRFNNEHADAGAMPHGQTQFTTAAAADLSDPATLAKYVDRRDNQKPAFQAVIDSALTEHELDAVLVPQQNSDWWAPLAGYPAVTMPIGYDPDNNHPYGMTLFGTAFSEASLLAMAYAYEQAAQVRRPPSEFNPVLAAAAAAIRPPTTPETTRQPEARTTTPSTAEAGRAVVENFAIQLDRFFRALGGGRSPAPDYTDEQWAAPGNWKPLEASLRAQLKQHPARGDAALDEIVETIRNRTNGITTAVVAVQKGTSSTGYIISNVEGNILVFDTLIEDDSADTIPRCAFTTARRTTRTPGNGEMRPPTVRIHGIPATLYRGTLRWPTSRKRPE